MIAFGKSASQRLRESVDDFIDMSGDTKKFLLTPGRFSNLPFIGAGVPPLPEDDDNEPKVVGSDTDS
jgi:hypothetical protein